MNINPIMTLVLVQCLVQCLLQQVRSQQLLARLPLTLSLWHDAVQAPQPYQAPALP